MQIDVVNHFREADARWFIDSIFKKEYNSGKGFQATISSSNSIPGAKQSLRCDYKETLLQSTCDQ